MTSQPWAWSPGPTAIDDHFELWAARVEQLVGRPIDRKAARTAFECYEPPKKALAPEEYARELQMLWNKYEEWNKYNDQANMYGAARPYAQADSRVVRVPNAETVAALKEAERGGGKTYRGTTREIIKAMTRASREPPRIWKRDAPIQRIINWIWWLTGTRP